MSGEGNNSGSILMNIDKLLRYGCWLALLFAGQLLRLSVAAAVIDVTFANQFLEQGNVDHPVLAVNVGDTVRWTYTEPSAVPPHLRAYGGVWDSGVLPYLGSFSLTFTNAGFFAYNTGGFDAVVIVLPWTNEPPTITINDPIDGLRLPTGASGFRALASVGIDETNVVGVSFLLGTNVLTTITNPPYAFNWQAPTNADVALTAELIRHDGSSTVSSAAHLMVGGTGTVYYPRVLPSGEIAALYTTSPVYRNAFFEYKDALTDIVWSPVRRVPTGYGVAVDTNAVIFSRRFYRVAWGEVPPP